MAHKLDFRAIEQELDPTNVSARSRRWGRREANPTVQMSVRMREDVYERFRTLAEGQRYTNGEMMEVMLEHYLSCEKLEKVKKL